MAEATTEQSRNNKYYCHQCSEEINPKLPDFVCPQCDNGFIEELTRDLEEHNGIEVNADPAAQFAEQMWGRTFFDSFRGRQDAADNRDTANDDSESHLTHHHHHHHHHHPPHRVMFSSRMAGGPSGNHPHIEGILQQLLGGLAGGAFLTGSLPLGGGSLHANPGDYVWGSNGLDAIITQLLNQIDGAGPPPAEEKDIENLKTVLISQSQVDCNIQCSVCMDDFKYDEPVKRLPCLHHYHKDCIVPWLKIHGTCPVCRKDLQGKDTSDKNYDSFPPPQFSDSYPAV